MPSEMYERGRRDAEADALDESYYQYYYDYKLGYNEAIRNRRRTRRQRILSRAARWLVRAVPIVLLVGGVGFAAYRRASPVPDLTAASTPKVMRTPPSPMLVPPTPRPPPTPTPELALRPNGFAVVTGTQGAPLRARTAPGTDTEIVTRFKEGQTLKLIEGPREASGMTWWRVEGDGKSGWASATYLKPVVAPK